jgi:hypothetical protein
VITEKDLQEAIAECQGKRNPNAETCIMLAAFLTIQKEMFGKQDESPIPVYSYASAPVGEVTYNSDTEFSQSIQNMPVDEILEIIDELMTTLQVVNPRLYSSVIRKIQS